MQHTVRVYRTSVSDSQAQGVSPCVVNDNRVVVGSPCARVRAVTVSGCLCLPCRPSRSSNSPKRVTAISNWVAGAQSGRARGRSVHRPLSSDMPVFGKSKAARGKADPTGGTPAAPQPQLGGPPIPRIAVGAAAPAARLQSLDARRVPRARNKPSAQPLIDPQSSSTAEPPPIPVAQQAGGFVARSCWRLPRGLSRV